MAEKKSKPVSVVTGGAGFLGSHLADRLLKEGHRVIAIDNLITGNPANIGHLAGNPDFQFIKHNVSNFIFLPQEKLDYVFHFASPASPIDYLELPIPTLKVGALGTHNSLGLLRVGLDRWNFQTGDERFSRTDQHWQPARDDDQTVRGGNHPHHGRKIADGLQAAAGGRSQSAATGYFSREKNSWLGAKG